MNKDAVLKIIDEVMNNREIDSIRNAILAIRDKIIELEDESEWDDFLKRHTAKLELRGNNPLAETSPYFKGAKYVCIDTTEKIDTGYYGTIWYE